jgi:hypothetical protein
VHVVAASLPKRQHRPARKFVIAVLSISELVFEPRWEGQTNRHSHSLLGSHLFPVSGKRFPVPFVGNFTRETLVFQWVLHAGGGRILQKFPVFSRLSGNLAGRDSFAIFGSLPKRSERSARSAEFRHQLKVFFSELRPESASQRKNATSFPVYLYSAFSGVTLGEAADGATIRLAP